MGEPREDHVVRRHHTSLRSFFPGLNERSRSTRRTRDLWAVIPAVRISVHLVLDARELEETAVSDSAPVPCLGDTRAKAASEVAGFAEDGVWSSTALTSVGLTLHSVVSLTGVVMGFLLTGVSHDDTQPVVELLDSCAHHLTRLLGDGASPETALQTFLAQDRGVEVLAPVKRNQPSVRSKQAQQQLTRLRLICETVHVQVQEQWHMSTHDAKSTWNLLTRIAAKLTAHRVGMMVNQLLGRPRFPLADVAVSLFCKRTTRTKRTGMPHSEMAG